MGLAAQRTAFLAILVVVCAWLVLTLGVPVGNVALGVVTLVGCWWGCGRWVCRRLGCDDPWVALVSGIALWSAIAGGMTFSRLAELFPYVQWFVGAPVGLLVLLRAVQRPLPPDRHRFVELALVGTAVTFASWLVWPDFVERGGVVELTGFYLTDGLWFAGSSAAVERGIPLEDPRLSGIPLAYHLQSLLVARGAAAALGAPHAPTLYYVLVPLWLGLAAALGASTLRRLAPDAGMGWIVLAGLGTSVLPDAASVAGFLVGGESWLDYFGQAPPHMSLGSHRVVGMLINVPFASSVVCGLAAVRWWIHRDDGVTLAEANAIGVLLFACAHAKGSAAPLWLSVVGVGLAWQVYRRRPAGSLAVLLGWLLAAQGLLFLLLTTSGLELLPVPWFLAHYFAFRYPTLTFDLPALDLVTWAVLAIGWQAFACAPTRAAPTRLRETRVGLCVGLVVGVVLANTVTFSIPGGLNELYFSSWMLAMLPPWAIWGLWLRRDRTWARAVGSVAIGAAGVGLVHLIAAARVSSDPVETSVGPDRLPVLRWLRDQTPSASRVLYFRFTVLDNDQPRWPPLNEVQFLVSGFAERSTVSEGSKYQGLYLEPAFQSIRRGIFEFYSGQMSDDQARTFLAKHQVDFVLSEQGLDLRAYGDLLRLAAQAERLEVYVVDPRIHGSESLR